MIMIWLTDPHSTAGEALAFLSRLANESESALRSDYENDPEGTMTREGLSHDAKDILMEEDRSRLLDLLSEGGLRKV